MAFNQRLIGLTVIVVMGIFDQGCEKINVGTSAAAPAALTVVDAMPESNYLIPIINTGSAVEYFHNAWIMWYGSFYEYSPNSGNDTVYVVQYSDTSNINPKGAGNMFNGILNLAAGKIYSLFLTGKDTVSRDFLFTTDTLPYHNPTDSTVGIRFVNLSTGSNPMSVNLEGSASGSEVGSLPYKGITGFKNYICNSSVTNLTNGAYLFVVRDAMTSDSVTSFSLNGIGSGNGVGLIDPNNGFPLTFKNVTIAIYGSGDPASNFPITAMLIDNY